MLEPAASETSRPPATKRSWKLAAVVIILAILPPLLLFLFFYLALLWIAPRVNEAVQVCSNPFRCPVPLILERLEMLFILGPSTLVGVASILLG